ncbi:MAG: NAD(P)H-dependent oxidoreductase [Sediminibacterium sp.]|nr:NAD(P)H-dependent oxidoreductase [Sediminibacterium sp.]
MKKILAFGGSNSKHSINQKFATYTAQLFSSKASIFSINIADFETSIYSIDAEKKSGIPEIIVRFYDHIEQADFIIISLAEYNGSYTTAFKNIIDWTSRYKKDFLKDKPLFLLSTSPGSRGGINVMDAALSRFKIFGAHIIEHFSLPFYDKNFDPNLGIIDQELAHFFLSKIQKINEVL